jgi:hypothetical protein
MILSEFSLQNYLLRYAPAVGKNEGGRHGVGGGGGTESERRRRRNTTKVS